MKLEIDQKAALPFPLEYQLPVHHLQIYRNFVENMPGIFTLGEATIEEEKIIKEKNEQLNQIEEEGKNYQKNIDKLKEKKNTEESNLMQYLWDNIYRRYSEFSDACSL